MLLILINLLKDSCSQFVWNVDVVRTLEINMIEI